jgi:hypothetical protein
MSNVTNHKNVMLGDTVMTSIHKYDNDTNAIFVYIEPCDLKVSTFSHGFSFALNSGNDRVYLHFMDTQLGELLAAIGKEISNLHDQLSKED